MGLFRKSEEEKLRIRQAKLRDDFLDACERGKRSDIEKLIAEGAAVNERNADGTTPLFVAVNNGNIEATKLLIEKNADVNAKTISGAGFSDKFPVGSTPLLIACRMSDSAIADILLKNSADIKAQDCYGLTALHYAAKRGNLPLIKLLLENGADINAKDQFGHTAEFFARDNEHDAAATFLQAKSGNKPPPPQHKL